MEKLRHLDLFAGIGGFSLGLERSGLAETVAFCEIEPFCQKVLNKHWPGVPIYDDVRELTNDRLESDGITNIGIITGGFPCQDISVAGNQKGIEAERSGLWSELCRIIGEVRPDYAIIENVTALLSGDGGRWFQRVLWDIWQIGFNAEWHCISASAIGAHHHRDRVWIICYPQHNGLTSEQKFRGNETASNNRRKKEQKQTRESKRTSRSRNVQSIRRGEAGGERSAGEILGNTKKLQRNDNHSHRKNGKCEISEPGNSGSENDMANTNNTRDRTPSSRIDSNRKKENKERGKQSQPELGGQSEDVPNTVSQRGRGRNTKREDAKDVRQLPRCKVRRIWQFETWDIESSICRVAHGIPRRVDRLKGLGNSVVPQIPELIGRAIKECMNESNH